MEKAAIILAAGVSSRMNTQMPKVLHEVCGRAMLDYVLEACRQAGVTKIYVVVGFGAEQVQQKFADADDVVWVRQEEQKGTAHAVMCCTDYLQNFEGDTLILCGDGPLIQGQTLKVLVDKHEKEKSAVTLATALLDDPTGYGRIVRDDYGNIEGIVEHSDCDEKQKQIKEVNPSYYCFDNQKLLEALKQIKPDNIKGEYYLTDALSILISSGNKVVAVTAVRPEEAMSVNSRSQLSAVGKVMQSRVQNRLMENGVTIVDPVNTWIDSRAQIGQDTTVEPFTYIHGSARIGSHCRIGPFAYIEGGTELKDGTITRPVMSVKFDVAEESKEG